MKPYLPFALALLASPALAQDNRQLHAHEHGVGALNIAFDGQAVAMELHVPGADIVGFEYAATRAEDRAAIDAAVATLARPLDLFGLPEAAACTVTQASAALQSEDAHDHEDEHAAHGDEHHEEHAHEHDEDAASHTEFHAQYVLSCADPGAISQISFAYFDAFEHARALEVQIVSASGARAFEVERDAPVLDLRGMF